MRNFIILSALAFGACQNAAPSTTAAASTNQVQSTAASSTTSPAAPASAASPSSGTPTEAIIKMVRAECDEEASYPLLTALSPANSSVQAQLQENISIIYFDKVVAEAQLKSELAEACKNYSAEPLAATTISHNADGLLSIKRKIPSDMVHFKHHIFDLHNGNVLSVEALIDQSKITKYLVANTRQGKAARKALPKATLITEINNLGIDNGKIYIDFWVGCEDENEDKDEFGRSDDASGEVVCSFSEAESFLKPNTALFRLKK